MCETRDLGIKWPHWHTLIFEGDRSIDMRYVCPKDERSKLLQQAKTACWKKWVAKHEYEELKEGIWLEPALALLHKKTKEEWTEKHRNAARKWVLEIGGVQKRLFDIGWSDESESQNGTRSEGSSQKPPEKWSKKRKPQRRSGSGKEVLLNILSQCKSMEQEPFQYEKVGVCEAQELEHASRRLQGPRCH